MRSIGHFIGGREVKGTSGRTADVFEPMTGDVQAKVALASKAEVARRGRECQGRAAGMGRHQSAAPRSRDDEVPGTGRSATTTSWPTCLAREHGKTVPDAKGDILRGARGGRVRAAAFRS